MNCKQGDLAEIVRSSAGNEGKIVRCLEFLPQHKWRARDGTFYEADSWRIDIALRGWSGRMSSAAKDDQLQPIRDPGDDAVDETLINNPVRQTESA